METVRQVGKRELTGRRQKILKKKKAYTFSLFIKINIMGLVSKES